MPTPQPPADAAPNEQARGFMDKDAFARRLGIRILEWDAAHCVCQMPVDDQHRNGAGVAHGGAVFSLADFAAACVANAQGKRSLGINGYVNFIAAAARGPLTATARRVRAGKTLVHSEVAVVDGEGRLVATLATSGFLLADEDARLRRAEEKNAAEADD